MEEMRMQSSHCQHCLSGIGIIYIILALSTFTVWLTKSLPTITLRLWSHHLLVNGHLCWIQVNSCVTWQPPAIFSFVEIFHNFFIERSERLFLTFPYKIVKILYFSLLKAFFSIFNFLDISVKGNFFSSQIFFSLGLPLGGVNLRRIYEIIKVFLQFLWLAELELESVLQPDLHLPGNVASKCPRDVRKPDNQLHRWNIRANESQLSKLYGGEGAYYCTCQGWFFAFMMNFQTFRRWRTTTPMRRISPL